MEARTGAEQAAISSFYVNGGRVKFQSGSPALFY
jgi:hypothetical protein